jgi:hypothetical protein
MTLFLRDVQGSSASLKWLGSGVERDPLDESSCHCDFRAFIVPRKRKISSGIIGRA